MGAKKSPKARIRRGLRYRTYSTCDGMNGRTSVGLRPRTSPRIIVTFMIDFFVAFFERGANRRGQSGRRIRTMLQRGVQLALAALILACACPAQEQIALNQTLPVDQVRPGMQGYAYTIFAGDQVEKFDLEVIGVMPNFLGPKQSIILVQLKGPKVEHTGVVAGMSGSPVYIEGKLAGALSLKLGIFTKEPIAGVTPIADVLAGGGGSLR